MSWNHERSHTHDGATLSITGGGAHPDLAAHDALGLATDAEVSAHVNAPDPHVAYALDADLANHEADTTAIHGIPSTASLILTNDSRLSDARTPLIHTHTEASVTNLTADLAAKAPAAHSHVEADVTALVTDLAGKAPTHAHPYAPTAHVHAEADTTNLAADLAAKAAAAHVHAEADTTSLVADLAGKAPSVHAHAPVYTSLANGAVAMAFGTNGTVKVIPTATATYTTTVPAAGTHVHLIVLTSGVASFTITFGAGFKPTATLATGTVTARVFVLAWISDGVSLYEVSRSVAMVA